MHPAMAGGMPAQALPEQDRCELWKWQDQVETKYIPQPHLLVVRRVRGAVKLRSSNIKLPDTVRLEHSGVDFETPIMRIVSVGPDVKLEVEDEDGVRRLVERGDLVLMGSGVGTPACRFDGDTTYLVHQNGCLGAVNGDSTWAKYWDNPLRNPNGAEQ